MARDFIGSPDILSRDTSPGVGDWPFTMAIRVYPDTTGADKVFMCIGSNNAASNSGFTLIGQGASDVVRTQMKDDAGNQITYNGAQTVTTGAWNAVGCSYLSDTSRTLYVNGVAETTSTASSNASTSRLYTAIGARRFNSTPGNDIFFNGRLAEAAIWSNVIAFEDHVAFSNGLSPLSIRPDLLIRYWKVVGRNSPETEMMGAFDLTVGSAPPAIAHPRIIMPHPRTIIVPAAAGGGGGDGVNIFSSGVFSGGIFEKSIID